MNRVLPSCVGLLFLVAACTAPSALSTRDTGHPASSVKSGAPPMLHFEGETIAHAAKAFNRYNRTKIVIDDPDIADRKVGGTFVRTDPESLRNGLRTHDEHPSDDGRGWGHPNDPTERGGSRSVSGRESTGRTAEVPKERDARLSSTAGDYS